MTESRWIWMVNWDRFQHYSNRNPAWIKSYVELLSDDDGYLSLTMHRRATLHGLWLAFAMSRRRLPLDTARISQRLNGRVTMSDLEALIHTGFIEVCASSVLAEREQAYSRALASRAPARSQEEEVEREVETPEEEASLNKEPLTHQPSRETSREDPDADIFEPADNGRWNTELDIPRLGARTE